MKAVVERMCIACRTKMPKDKMLRIVKNKEGVVALDFGGKMSGRGAYICDNPQCIAKCCKAKLLSRVFEQPVTQEVYEAIEKQYADKQNR
ncbi:MAG: YlxR family protein [Clostridia bacterium]